MSRNARRPADSKSHSKRRAGAASKRGPDVASPAVPRLDAANLAGITSLMNTQHVKPGVNLDVAEKSVMGKPTRNPTASDPVAQYTKDLAQLADDLGIDLASDNPSTAGNIKKAPAHDVNLKRSAPSAPLHASVDDLFEDLDLGSETNRKAPSDHGSIIDEGPLAETKAQKRDDRGHKPRDERSQRDRRDNHKRDERDRRERDERDRRDGRDNHKRNGQDNHKRSDERRGGSGSKPNRGGGKRKEEDEYSDESGSVSGSEYTDGSEYTEDGSEYTDASGEGDSGSEYSDESGEGDESDESSIDENQVLADLDRDLGITPDSKRDKKSSHKHRRHSRDEAPPHRDSGAPLPGEHRRKDEMTEEQENRGHINSVFGDLRRETTTTFSAETARVEDIKANKLEQIGQLRMVLDDEGIDTSAIEVPTAADSMEKIDGILNTLKLKNDRNRYSSLAEEVILGGAEGIESVFDGTRSIPILGWTPDYTGYSNTVNCKLHRMRFETSQIVGQIIEKHRIGPTARIIMELLPSFFLYPRQQRKQRGAPGLVSDPKMAGAPGAVVGDARMAYAAIRASEQDAVANL